VGSDRSDTKLPSPDEIKVRLFLSVTAVAIFVLLGLWLRTDSLLAWFSTALIVALVSLIHSTTLATNFNRQPSNLESFRARFESLVQAVNEVPALRPFTTSLAVKIFVAIVFGFVVASIEQLVVVKALDSFGVPTEIVGVLSLALVLFPIYATTGYLQLKNGRTAATWLQRLEDAVADLFGVDRRRLGAVPYALGAAAFRTAASVLLRSLALLILPQVFDNPYAIACVSVTAVFAIVTGDYMVHILRTSIREAIPKRSSSLIDEPNREPNSDPNSSPSK
jgi:hypothetical protein